MNTRLERLQTPPTRPRRRRALAVLGTLLAVTLGLVGVVVVLSAHHAASPAVPPGRPVTLIVPAGASTSQIADLLQQRGVVSDAGSLVSLAVSDGQTGNLKPGTYHLVTGMADSKVLQALVTGPPLGPTITFPEGFTVAQIVRRLEQHGYSAASVRAALGSPTLDSPYRPRGKPLEGLLFPATYPVAHQTPLQILQAMEHQLGVELGSVNLDRARAAGLSPYDVLIVASLIEREARLPGDRSKVSAVIYNRLRAGMPLQFNSTIEYALGKPTTDLPYADTKLRSPYNTYLHAGLPPTPIANPGLAAIQAAANPAPGNWKYFVVTSRNGGETFTASYSHFLSLLAKARAEGFD